jgi:hypothetical protein
LLDLLAEPLMFDSGHAVIGFFDQHELRSGNHFARAGCMRRQSIGNSRAVQD